MPNMKPVQKLESNLWFFYVHRQREREEREREREIKGDTVTDKQGHNVDALEFHSWSIKNQYN